MKLPTFNDGIFSLYTIIESDDVCTDKKLKKENTDICFEELSVSDRLRSQLDSSNVDISMKIRIPQYKKINSMSVLKIDGEYHKVYNAYHFKNDDGFEFSDLTLTNWEGAYEEI